MNCPGTFFGWAARLQEPGLGGGSMGVRDTRMSQSNILALCQEKAPLGCVLKHRQRSRGGRVATDLEFVETLLWADMMFSPRISVPVWLSAPQVSTHFVTVARRQHLHGNKHNNHKNCQWLSASFPQMLRTCFLRQRPETPVGWCSDGFKRAQASGASQHVLKEPAPERT